MRKLLFVWCLLLLSSILCRSQSIALDKYYQDKILSCINLGKSLSEKNEKEAAKEYYLEAIKLAEKRTGDYFCGFLIINNKVLEPIIEEYYSQDSISAARHLVDLYFIFFERTETKLLKEGDINQEEYLNYMEYCYILLSNLTVNHLDYDYSAKYGRLYLLNARKQGKSEDEYLMLYESYIWSLIFSCQYDEAFKEATLFYKESNSLGKADTTSLKMIQSVHDFAMASSGRWYGLTDDISIPKRINESWINFVSPLYDSLGASYMNDVLMYLDQMSSMREELEKEYRSSSLMASKLSQVCLIYKSSGFEESKKALLDLKKYIHNHEDKSLWPIACLHFVEFLETQKHYSAVYRLCKLVESDFAKKENYVISDSDYYTFFMYYFGACDRVEDIRKEIEIYNNCFKTVKVTDDEYWIITRLKGSFCLKVGLFEEGLQNMLEALDHYKQPWEGDYITYSGLFSYIGQAYRRLGKIEEAIFYHQKCLDLCDKYKIPEHKELSLFELGVIYYYKGDLAKAKDYFLSSANIKSNKKDIYQISAPYSYLFDIERRLGHVEQARQYLSSMWQATIKEYLSFKDYLTVQEQIPYWAIGGGTDVNYLGELVYKSAPKYNDIYYDIVLASKGFLLRAEAVEYKNVMGSGDDLLIDLYLSTHSGDNHNQEEIDNYLSRYHSHHFKSEIEHNSWKYVQTMLSKSDLAIEFVRYDTDKYNQNYQYGALLLKTGWEYPKFVHICSEKDLLNITKTKQKAYSVDGLIYKLIWEPLEKELKGVKNVYYSPEGLLHLLNLSAITDNNGVPLFKRFNLFRLSSTQNIAGISNPAIKTSYVYGGLIYDTDYNTMLQEHRKYGSSVRSLNDPIWVGNSSFSRHGWSYLPSTQTETDVITDLLQSSNIDVTRYSGVAGTEESFKAISGKHPGLIHLATHGFYLNYSYADSTAIADNHEKKIASSSNAMVRSGIILSNGGLAWRGETIPDGVEDGILQADEIANLNLTGTSLLVLSACETALGDISSDGVYGLQRAFKKAGVGTIIMSLWEVDDKATSLFMSYFYETWTSGKSKHDAFVNAQTHLMSLYSDPYYWAAFIMLD